MTPTDEASGTRLARAVLAWVRGTGEHCLDDLYDLAVVVMREAKAVRRSDAPAGGPDPFLLICFVLTSFAVGYAIGVEHAARLCGR